MLIREAIQRQGEVCFRHRGKYFLLLVPAWLFALGDSEWLELRFGDFVDDLFDWSCFALSAAGVALRVATVAYVPRRTSGRNTTKGQVADTLNTTGMYSIVRHPLYLANGVVLTGFLLATGSLWLTAVGLLACCLFYERIAYREEAFLEEQFGPQYLAWADRTPAFMPSLARWAPPEHAFCWRTAMKREYLTVFGVIAAFTLLDYTEDLLALGTLELEAETTVLFSCGLGLFLLVRYLRKNTGVFRVAGR